MENKFAVVLKGVTWGLFIFDLIGAIALSSTENGINWLLFLGYLLIFGIATLIILAIAEIIKLLQENINETRKNRELLSHILQNNSVINLQAGRYIVGDFISAGHYMIKASGNLHIFDVDYNDTIDDNLNGGSWDCDLNDGDTIEVTEYCELKRM